MDGWMGGLKVWTIAEPKPLFDIFLLIDSSSAPPSPTTLTDGERRR